MGYRIWIIAASVICHFPFTATAQSERMTKRLNEAENLEKRALVYYDDFLQANYGEHPWWSVLDDDRDTTQPRTMDFPHSADSALAILYGLYWQEEKDYLYYPIVQLEHFLGLKHDAAIVPPDTSGYYLPLQSGTYADLGAGWETNYRQHLLLHTKWAMLHCKEYTEMFREFNEPDLWHMRNDTMVRMTVFHLPGTGFSLIRVFKKNGQPTAMYIDGHQMYKDKKWCYVPDERREERLSSGQWQEAMRLVAAIDTLPWEERGQTIDGERYQFEYRHGDSFHSHYSCFDRSGLGGFLFRLFFKDYRTWDEIMDELD